MAQREYDSFAIGVLNDGNAVAPLSLSINVWADVGHTSEIDFGVQIPHRDDISGFFIFVPFQIEKNDVVDLAPSFRDSEFNQVLFNQDCETTCRLNRTVVTDARGDSLLVLPISQNGGLTVDNLEGGTFLSFCCDPSVFPYDYSSLYFRMRLPFVSLDDLLSGPDDMREVITGPIVPFRTMNSIAVNQVRGLPSSVVSKLVDSKTDIGESHIAVIAPRQWEVNSFLTPYGVRPLEKIAWEKYQPRLKSDSTILNSKGSHMFVYQ